MPSIFDGFWFIAQVVLKSNETVNLPIRVYRTKSANPVPSRSYYPPGEKYGSYATHKSIIPVRPNSKDTPEVYRGFDLLSTLQDMKLDPQTAYRQDIITISELQAINTALNARKDTYWLEV